MFSRLSEIRVYITRSNKLRERRHTTQSARGRSLTPRKGDRAGKSTHAWTTEEDRRNDMMRPINQTLEMATSAAGDRLSGIGEHLEGAERSGIGRMGPDNGQTGYLSGLDGREAC